MIKVERHYRHVVRDTDRHGNVRVYLRQPGKPKVRLYTEPGTDAFDAEYRAAVNAKPKKPAPQLGKVLPGSVDALCIAYYKSAEFRRMDERTQRVRRQILDRFRVERGDKPAARLEPRHLVVIRDAKADTPEAANGLLKALRAAYRHGMAVGLVDQNPALRVSYLPGSAEGFHAWTLEEVARFEAHWPVGSKPRLAMALMLYTGQRRSDVVQFGRQHVRDGWLRFTQHKNRNKRPVRLELPIIPELQQVIDATSTGELTFLVSGKGTPYSAETFGNSFRRWCREAGLPLCSPHGLRKAAAARLAELGCTAHEIMAVTGHRTLKEVDRYTRGAAQRVMAESAFSRLIAASAGNEKSHPNPGRSEWDESDSQATENKGDSKWMVPRAGIEPATLRFSVACSTN